MFKFLFARNRQKSKTDRDEYTPELDGHQQIHDETEGSEFLDDVVEMEEEPASDEENNRA